MFSVSDLRRRRLWLWAAAIVSIVAGIYFFKAGRQTSRDAPLFEPVVRGSIENYIGATGTLEPRQYVEVGAQVSGQVQKIYVAEGDVVKAGQLLVDIDATVFETKVRNSEAGLDSKRAELQELQAELELAAFRARRNENLHRQKAVSDDVLQESQTNEKILRARIQATEAQIKADAASLAGDKATLGYARIYAPIDGTVVTVQVREGQTINANQNAPVLLKIANLDVLTLRAEVSEADVTRLYKGMPVYFKTFGGGERRWHSTVRQVLPTPEIVNDVVLYQALIDVENHDGRLMDAMTAQVFFVVDKADDALLVPLAAVRKGRQGGEVMVKTDDGIVPAPVKLGVRNRTQAQLLEGPGEGSLVLVGDKAGGNAKTPRGLTNGTRGRPRGF